VLSVVAARDKTYEEALKEMMDRIKTGQALKSTTGEARVYLLIAVKCTDRYQTDLLHNCTMRRARSCMQNPVTLFIWGITYYMSHKIALFVIVLYAITNAYKICHSFSVSVDY